MSAARLSSERLAAARREATLFTPAEVEVETAWAWAARAVARREAAEAFDRAADDSCGAWRAHDDALHEALEHAALVRDGGRTLRQIERALATPNRRRR